MQLGRAAYGTDCHAASGITRTDAAWADDTRVLLAAIDAILLPDSQLVLVAQRAIAGIQAATLAWHDRRPVSDLRALHAEACENAFDLMSLPCQLLRRYSKEVE